jgi:hypothetical protein
MRVTLMHRIGTGAQIHRRYLYQMIATTGMRRHSEKQLCFSFITIDCNPLTSIFVDNNERNVQHCHIHMVNTSETIDTDQ